MIDMVTGTRMVVVVGRGRSAESPSGYVARAADRGMPLVVLTVGYPLSAGQQSFVTESIDQAFELRVHLDAQIVSEAAALQGHVARVDEVTVVAAGRDERRIGSILAHLPP